MNLTKKWTNETLTRDDIVEYLDKNQKSVFMDENYLEESTLKHAARTLYSLYQYAHRNLPPGHYGSALLEGDLYKAVGHADAKNTRSLPLAVMFVQNVIPMRDLGLNEKEKAV